MGREFVLGLRRSFSRNAQSGTRFAAALSVCCGGACRRAEPVEGAGEIVGGFAPLRRRRLSTWSRVSTDGA
jgi:hypothetical protein